MRFRLTAGHIIINNVTENPFFNRDDIFIDENNCYRQDDRCFIGNDYSFNIIFIFILIYFSLKNVFCDFYRMVVQ